MTDQMVYGPLDFLLVQFPGDRFPGSAAEELLGLVDRGTIRLYDLLLIAKDGEGKVRAVDLGAAAADAPSLSVLIGARSGIFGEDDIEEAATAMDPGSVAALVLFENLWAVPFVRAASKAGGEVVAGARVAAQDVAEVLDEMEAVGA